jgi:hypothetical protein
MRKCGTAYLLAVLEGIASGMDWTGISFERMGRLPTVCEQAYVFSLHAEAVGDRGASRPSFKTEPKALVSGFAAPEAAPVRPEASAYGSRENRLGEAPGTDRRLVGPHGAKRACPRYPLRARKRPSVAYEAEPRDPISCRLHERLAKSASLV